MPIDAPPPKPKPKTEQASEGLAEVERALSVLKGRHPEHERVRREDEERRAKRKAELDAKESVASRERMRRLGFIGGASAIALAALVVLGLSFRREIQRRGRLEQAADPYRAVGFALIDTSSRGEAGTIRASVAAGCVLAATTNGAGVEITVPGGKVSGGSPAVTCLCEGAEVTASAESALPSGEGIVLLRIDAPAVGGSRAFPFLPFKAGAVGATDAACADASLDVWLDAKAWTQEAARGGGLSPAGAVDAADGARWFDEGKRASLRDLGLRVASVVRQAAPFSVVEVPAASCVLVDAEAPADRPGLRLRGGALAVAPPENAMGDVAWCTSTATTVTVQRAAKAAAGSVTVVVGPAEPLGGLGGFVDAVTRAGISLAAAKVGGGDHGWNAKELLVASEIPTSLIAVAAGPDFGADPEARIVAVSVDEPDTVFATTADGVFSYCDPPLEKTMSSLCIFSGAQRWSSRGSADVAGGIARSKLPFWLFALQDVGDPPALRLEVELLGLARQLRRAGFEPTTIDAVTDTDKGAEVLGRANEDAVVVLGLTKTEPWVFPYTDGPAWTLGGEPRVVPIKPLERIQVTATAKEKLPPKALRRSLVFRRHVAGQPPGPPGH